MNAFEIIEVTDRTPNISITLVQVSAAVVLTTGEIRM